MLFPFGQRGQEPAGGFLVLRLRQLHQLGGGRRGALRQDHAAPAVRVGDPPLEQSRADVMLLEHLLLVELAGEQVLKDCCLRGVGLLFRF